MTSRAVITGLGVVAPSGMSAREHWATVTQGTSRLAPISGFDASDRYAIDPLVGLIEG